MKQQELLNEQLNNTEQNQNGSVQIHREHIPETPFHVIGNEEKGYFVAIGKYRLSEYQKTIDEAKQLIHHRDWNLIINAITILSEEIIIGNQKREQH